MDRRSDTQALPRARRVFIASWSVVSLVKVVLAIHLPLFVDEAFYWQEGQRLAWAYSDLPGLTAWLTRIGVEVGGHSPLALRAPFLLIASAIPWLVGMVARREFGAVAGWRAATCAVLLPLAGSLGLLAVPDPVMVFATLVCMDAIARLLRSISAGATLELALGLAIGALSHYRFIAVIGVGMLVLLALRDGRRLLADPRVWVAIMAGAAAWTPLVAWNMDNAEAGLRFQLVDRHPWSFHAEGIAFLLIQALLVTPLLLLALGAAAWKNRAETQVFRRMLAWLGALIVLGFFVLGFFADTERVSFHWPLPGYVALLPLVPAVLAAWSRRWRLATYAVALAGLVAVLGYYAAVSLDNVRERSAAEKWYPANFAGWDTLADAVGSRLDQMPANTRLVAGNFKVGSELGFAMRNPDIQVLDHPLNRKHGRAPQLKLWGLASNGRSEWGGDPVLLVVGSSDVPYRELLAHYHGLCATAGPLPPPHVVNVDHGRRRFLLFAMPQAAPAKDAPCTTPAMAWIDQPVSGAAVPRRFQVSGWAFKDGVGIDRVEVTIDGTVVARARYGLPNPGASAYWRISTDPNHPGVGFSAQVDASSLPPGRHWLGLRLHGSDGSVEPWSEQPVDLR